MLSQGSQGAAGRAERSAARVGEGSAPDRVVLEGAGLAARAEVRVGRRFHGRHAGVIGVQVGVIHLIHGGEPVRTPGCQRHDEGGLRAERLGCVFFYFRRGNTVQTSPRWSVSPVSPRTAGLSRTPVSFLVYISLSRGCCSW